MTNKYYIIILSVFLQAGLSIGIKAVFLFYGESLSLVARLLIYSISLFLMGVYAILWQFVLKSLDLSIANSMMSIVPVLIFAGGVFFFNEKVSINNFAGFIMIISGLLMIAYSKIRKSDYVY